MEGSCYIAIGFATEGWMIFVMLVPLCIASIAGPTLQSEATAQVAADKQGELQGTIISILSLTAIVTPVVATLVHSAFNTPAMLERFGLPGAAFLLGGLLSAGATVAWWATQKTVAVQAVKA